MNCKVSWPRVSNGFCTVLNSPSNKIKFKKMFHIKFCVKCDWNFRGFLKIHITFYKHVSNINICNNIQQNYLPIKLLRNLLAAFFIAKIRFLSIFFQNQNLAWGYTREKSKLESKVYLCTHFWDYLHEKPIFWRELNWVRESSTWLMTWV